MTCYLLQAKLSTAQKPEQIVSVKNTVTRVGWASSPDTSPGLDK